MNRADNKSLCNRHGFTLIELMLSMSFISMLLIVIMLTILQITNMYNKGLSMREVNQAGRSISDDLLRTIASSAPFDVSGDEGDVANRYIIREGGGRLCTGKTSYLWNYSDGAAYNFYENNEPVRIVKLPDATGEYCLSPAKKVPTNGPDVVDMLKSGDRDLVIHSFSVSQAAEANDLSTGQALYAVKFIIGTNDKELLTDNNAGCKPPSETGRGIDSYCAVNRFEIVARAGNRTESNE